LGKGESGYRALAAALNLDLPRFFEKEDPDIGPIAFERGLKEAEAELKARDSERWAMVQELKRKSSGCT
jgi:hypothetical protein